MGGLPPIDAPTAAVIGGVSGFVADNATGIIQRRLRRRGEEKRAKIQWYEDLIQLTREIRIILVTHEQLQDFWSNVWDETMTEDDVSKAIDNLSVEEFLNGELEIDGMDLSDAVTTEFDLMKAIVSSEKIKEEHLPKEEMKAVILNAVDSKKWERKEAVRSQIQSDMGSYQDRLTEHLASATFNIDNTVNKESKELLSLCFGMSASGIISDDTFDDTHEIAEKLIEACTGKIEQMEENRTDSIRSYLGL